jgi:CheY-like chemotaxis protein
MHPQGLSARQLLEEVLAGVRADASGRDAPVYVRGREVAVWADPVLLRRVLHNLASNAVRHSGGAVLLAARRRGDGCELQVWDEGPGISEAHQQEIFEEFVQLDNPGRKRSRGLGLGLAMVQRICQQCGWLLRVRSQPGRGSMFSVEVPLSQHGALLASGAFSLPPPSEAQQGMIVLVEDDEQVREAMAVTLGAVGYRVLAYDSAEAALASLPSARPEVLVSDYRLGGSMTGAQWIAHARRALGESVPAVLISGEVHLGQEGAEALPERTHHAQKPVSAAHLIELVAQAHAQR